MTPREQMAAEHSAKLDWRRDHIEITCWTNRFALSYEDIFRRHIYHDDDGDMIGMEAHSTVALPPAEIDPTYDYRPVHWFRPRTSNTRPLEKSLMAALLIAE